MTDHNDDGAMTVTLTPTITHHIAVTTTTCEDLERTRNCNNDDFFICSYITYILLVNRSYNK